MSFRVFGTFMPSESQSDEHLHKRNHQPHNRCNKRTQNPGQHKQQDNPRPIRFDFAERLRIFRLQEGVDENAAVPRQDGDDVEREQNRIDQNTVVCHLSQRHLIRPA